MKVSASCNYKLVFVPACCLRSADGSCVSTAHPPGLLASANGQLSGKARPFSRASSIGRRAQLSSATRNWRHRVDADDGESGGRDVYCDSGKHARRAAAPNHRHSSFSYTCCPYGRCIAVDRVERSDERLNIMKRFISSMPA